MSFQNTGFSEWQVKPIIQKACHSENKEWLAFWCVFWLIGWPYPYVITNLSYINFVIYTVLPLANIGRISGLPQDHVYRLSLNTESNSTGFSFHPANKNIFKKYSLFIWIPYQFNINATLNYKIIWYELINTLWFYEPLCSYRLLFWYFAS